MTIRNKKQSLQAVAIYPLLDKIDCPSDLKQLTLEQLLSLCNELRAFLIDSITQNGGHFAANLGTVELTVALHYVFDSPNDKLIWDVGHQAYGHKVLTGRRKKFGTNRKKGGISGFPKIEESKHDAFGTGHSSTSISAALGMATADKLSGKDDNKHIAIIGDGSLTGGVAFEALNNLAESGTNTLVIVNDNNMGIDPTPGAVNKHLAKCKTKSNNLFENLGIPYSGPFDGHQVLELVEEFKKIKQQKGVHLMHIKTLKGKGYPEAEKEQTKWHSTSSFVKLQAENKKSIANKKYQDAFGDALLELAKMNDHVVGVTPAMPTGSSMIIMQKAFPERVFDVGIAEQHAVTFSAGLALAGKRPVCHLYSTFMQRAYDQIVHDVALQSIPVVFCIDRAGNVGEDGPTHHGVFDLAFLKPIPNLVIAAPMNEQELRNMLFTAIKYKVGPMAIRYPKGPSTGMSTDGFKQVGIGTGRQIKKGEKIAVLSIGTIGNEVTQALEEVPNVGHYDLRFLSPLDEKLLQEVSNQYEHLITIEDGCIRGGFGESVSVCLHKNGFNGKVISLGYPHEFIGQGSRRELFKEYGLDSESLVRKLREIKEE